MTLEGRPDDSQPLRALIVDDEALARERLRAMLGEIPAVAVIGEAENGAAAVKAIVDGTPDLLFLDVQMPGLDGFGVLRCTRNAHRPIVVFVTAFDQHAIQAFEVHAADYLLKPVSRARLSEAVRRVRERLRAPPARGVDRVDHVLSAIPETPRRLMTIPLKTDGGTQLVKADEIVRIEADGDYAHLHGPRAVYTVRESLADLDVRLRPLGFRRVHRSTIVNVDVIRSIEPISKGDYYLVLRDGTKLRTSRHYRAEVQALLK